MMPFQGAIGFLLIQSLQHQVTEFLVTLAAQAFANAVDGAQQVVPEIQPAGVFTVPGPVTGQHAFNVVGPDDGNTLFHGLFQNQQG